MPIKSIWLFPYKQGSKSASSLGRALNRQIQRESNQEKKGLLVRADPAKTTFRPSATKTVINWGGSTLPPHIQPCNIINRPEAVGRVTNKRNFFQFMSEQRNAPVMPEWTTDLAAVERWIEEGAREGRPVAFARTKLTGHSGEGIVEIRTRDDLRKTKAGTLFTRYTPKRDEWRLHFSSMSGLFFKQKKVRNMENGEPNWYIRNHENGFNYANGEEYVRDMPAAVEREAQKAFECSELNFGAVDVIYNARSDTAYVLEINSAPGLEGTTLEKYTEQFMHLARA